MKRRKIRDRCRRLSIVTDLGGIKSAIGELRGTGYPKQPKLNKGYVLRERNPTLDEEWFVTTITEKALNHPRGIFKYPCQLETETNS